MQSLQNMVQASRSTTKTARPLAVADCSPRVLKRLVIIPVIVSPVRFSDCAMMILSHVSFDTLVGFQTLETSLFPAIEDVTLCGPTRAATIARMVRCYNGKTVANLTYLGLSRTEIYLPTVNTDGAGADVADLHRVRYLSCAECPAQVFRESSE